jgi:hypothetical protein
LKVSVSGIEQELKRIQIEIDNAGRNAIPAVAHKLVKELHAATPKLTGHASNSWEVVLEGNKAVIKNDVEYIGALNHGHSKQAPEFFIEKTILASNEVVPNGAIVSYR